MIIKFNIGFNFAGFFSGIGKFGRMEREGEMKLSEARVIMKEEGNNPELVAWIDFAIWCFLVYVILDILFMLILAYVKNSYKFI